MIRCRKPPNRIDRDGSLSIRGGTPLRGTVCVPGAKNSVGKIVSAAMLTDDPCEIHNVPLVDETTESLSLIKAGFGVQVWRSSERSFTILHGHARNSEGLRVSAQPVTRTSLLLVAPQLRHYGEAFIPQEMGGDPIGNRPIDFHLAGYQAMGAEVVAKKWGYHLKAAKGLRGTTIRLSFPSVSTTASLALAATTAEGITVLTDVATDPEIVELVQVLRGMGAQIAFDIGLRTLNVSGVKKLSGISHSLNPDRLVAGSFAIAAIASGGDITVKGVSAADLHPLLDTLNQCGAGIQILDNAIRFYGKGNLLPACIEAGPFPSFPSDYLPAMAVLLSQANGTSVLHDTVFENRIGHLRQLANVGVRIGVGTNCPETTPCRFRDGSAAHFCHIAGPSCVSGGRMNVEELRAGFAYMLAASLSGRWSLISNIDKLHRGYEDMPGVFERLGAQVHGCGALDATIDPGCQDLASVSPRYQPARP